jgi:hypothetical protein
MSLIRCGKTVMAVATLNLAFPLTAQSAEADEITRAVAEFQAIARPTAVRKRTSQNFYVLRRGLPARDVLALLGLPEQQQTAPVGFTNENGVGKTYRELTCFIYEGVKTNVEGFSAIRSWEVVFDKGVVRSWGIANGLGTCFDYTIGQK